MIAALLVPAALAHHPHDVLVDVAASPDGRVLAILDPNDTSQLLAADDGVHFALVGGDPTDDDLTAVAFVGGEWVIGTADGALWHGDREWARDLAVDGPIRALDGGPALLVATDHGLLHGSIGALVAEEPARAFAAGAWGEDGERIAVGEDGRVWYGVRDAPIAVLPRLPGGRKALSAAVTDAPIVGTTAGVYRWDGAWRACGALPSRSTDTFADEVRLVVVADGKVLVATGREALFVSTDGCATFARRWTGDAIRYDAIGFARDPSQAFVFADADGHELRVGGFDGFAVSHDDGATWDHADLLPADYSRGISLDLNGRARLYMGEYAGGVVWTDDGATWASSATGIIGLYGKDLVAGPGRDEVWDVTDIDVHRSTDAGATFHRVGVPIERTREIRHLRDGTWVLGGDEGEPASRIAVTADHGATFAIDDDYTDVVGANAILDLVDADLLGDDARLALLQKPARLAIRRDGAWSLTPTLAGFASGLAVWPPDRGTRLVLATTDGVSLSDDGGQTFFASTTPPEGHPRALIAGDDGALLVIDRAGRTWRSDDGGDSWFRTAATAIPAAVHDVTVAPDFAHAGFAALGTYAGAYATDDGGDSWARLPRVQRLEATSPHLVCTNGGGAPCDGYADSRAGAGGGVILPRDGTVRFAFSGDTFTVLGPADASAVSAAIDGVPAVPRSGDSYAIAEGWHDVVLTTDVAAGTPIDAVVCTSPGEAIPLPDPRGCGCGGGRSPGGWLMIAGIAVAIRRSGGSRRPAGAARRGDRGGRC